MISKRESVMKAVEHKRSESVPYNVELTGELMKRVAQAVGIGAGEFSEWAGNHCGKISYNVGGEYIKPGFYQDEFGVVWNRTGLDKDIGIIEKSIIPSPDLSLYTFPEPKLEEVGARTEKFLSENSDIFVFGKIGMTFFERAWSLCGMENLLTYFLLEPGFVNELFDKILEYNLKIIHSAVEYDIDGFYFGDDYGQQSGLLMSPDVWRTFIKPGLAVMFSVIKAKGKIVALHSCGNIEPILDDLIDIGLDIYQTVQPEVYDLQQLKANYHEKLTFWGGISTQKELLFLKPDHLRSCVRERIAVMGHNGGYIAAPTHRIMEDVSVENVMTLVDELKNQNR